MNTRKFARTLSLNCFRFIGFFFVLMAFMQFQDHFVGYAFVSLGIAVVIFYFTFREALRNRKPLI